MIKLIRGKGGRQIAVLQRDTHLSRWVEDTGDLCHDRTVREKITPLLRPGDWVVDVGANIGDHTVAYAEAVGESGKVLAFEPQGKCFACLCINLSDFPQVQPYYFGLSDKEEVVYMELDENNVGASFISTHVDLKLYPTFVMPLDHCALPRLNLLKIDVEGWEYHVLVGAAATIRRHRPIILCELNRGALQRNCVSPERIVRYLCEEFGYEIHFLDPKHDLSMEMVDALFLPKKG